MALDWEQVRARYRADGTISPIATSTRTLTVVEIDDERLHVRSAIWTKSLERSHLEEAVALIESEEMSPRWADFVEQYGKRVTKERRSLAAHVLKDLGYLE
jgi:hypothetical protein